MTPFLFLIPILPLGVIHSFFYGDWEKKMWGTAYIGKYLVSHNALPFTASGASNIGYHFPVFYGYLYYVVTGWMSQWMSPDMAVRFLVVFALLVQFILCFTLFEKLLKNPWMSLCISLLLHWRLYPQVNLYSRGATQEFFSTVFLTSSVFCLIWVVRSGSFWSRWALGALGGFLLALGLGNHAVTALVGGPCVLAVLVMLWPSIYHKRPHDRRTIYAIIGAVSVFVLVVLSPWLYATLEFLDKIPIGKSGGINFFPEIFDNFRTRLSLVPFDSRSLFVGLKSEAPYMTLQIDMPMLILVIGSFVALNIERMVSSIHTPLSLFSIVLMIFFLWCSASLTPYIFLPEFFQKIQMAYRLISYVDLFLILALVGLFWRPAGYSRHSVLLVSIMLVSLTLSFANVITRYNQNKSMRVERSSDRNASLAYVIPEDYPLFDYTSVDIPALEITPETQTLKVDLGLATDDENFGNVTSSEIAVTGNPWVLTNISAFEWNDLLLDGKKIPRENLRSHDFRLAFQVQEGPHKLQYQWNPAETWVKLKDLSLMALSLGTWIVILLCCFAAFQASRISRVF